MILWVNKKNINPFGSKKSVIYSYGKYLTHCILETP